MSSSNSKFLFKALLTVTGIAGTSALLGLPALALNTSQLGIAHHPTADSSLLLAQGHSGSGSGGSGTGSGGSSVGNGGTSAGNGSTTGGGNGSGSSTTGSGGSATDSTGGTSPGNGSNTGNGSSSDTGTGGGLGGSDSSNGVGRPGNAYENLNNRPETGPNGAEPLLQDNNNTDHSSDMNRDMNNGSSSRDDNTSGSGMGGGQGGTTMGSPINPANPDAEGGSAFERAPGTQPLPDAQQDSTGGMNNRTMMQQRSGQSGSSTDSGIGGGQGGTQGGPNYNNRVNPANPDPVGGQGLENAPSNDRLPSSSQQSPSGGSYYNSTPGTSGTSGGNGAGTGAGGSGNTGGVRALW